jgi:hypothetical protein
MAASLTAVKKDLRSKIRKILLDLPDVTIEAQSKSAP